MTPQSRSVVELQLLGDFEVRCAGEPIELHRVSQRVVSFVAIHQRRVNRSAVAAALWPDLSPAAGRGRVRDVVYKIKCAVPGLVRADSQRIELLDGVRVDFEAAEQQATLLLEPAAQAPDGPSMNLFCRDLLAGWDEEWLVGEQQSFAMLRLRALERLAGQRLAAARFHDAELACRSVIHAEPYRETAHLLLAQVYVSEGNAGQALRTLGDFQRRLKGDLGLGASDGMRHLAQAIRAGARVHPATSHVASA